MKDSMINARQLPTTKSAAKKSKPMRVSAAPYHAKGFVMDYVVVDYNSGPDYTFSSGTTYYINGGTYFSGTLTFQSGCVIKLSNNSYLMTYGTVAGGGATLTSKDDDLYGEVLQDSTGLPTFAGNPALWLYYRDSAVHLYSMKIRWAKTAVQFDPNYDYLDNTFEDSSLEHCQTGLYAGSGCTVSIYYSTECDVQTLLSDDNYGYSFSGSLTHDCSAEMDADGDGLRDAWEIQYFGNITSQNGTGDPDGDGLTNTREQQLGTNPNVSNNGLTTSSPLDVFTPLKN